VYLRIPVYVGATMEAALEEPRASTLNSYKRLAQSYANSATSEGAKMAEDRAVRGERLAHADYDELLRNRLAYGTPDVVAARLRDIGEQLGLSGFIIEPNVGGGIPRELVFASVQRFAREVAPQLR
jgi:alkanesulfonate monooxygenase SsuD/methylene tetrahydromethanopterin reductase-like flavin-dependent oxidoreductase (luciferase family)